MRCTQCDYPLWNLKARECPECGTSFRPSENVFRANSVRFCCPVCEQAYYGTDASGHLVPKAFSCVKCGTSVTMDQMVLRPAEGVPEERTNVDAHPWLDRKRQGSVKGWLRSVGRSMISPQRLMRSVPVENATGPAWRYAILTIAIIVGMGAAFPALGLGVVLLAVGDNDAVNAFMAGGGIFLGGLALVLIVIALWGLTAHGLLLVTGGANYSLGRTFQAICYSVGANVTCAIPCLGFYPFIFVGACWWLVSAILMLMEGQRVSGGRAAIVLLAFPALLATVSVGGTAGLTFYGVKQAQVAMATARSTALMQQQEMECTLVHSALQNWAAEHDGATPVHGVQVALGSSMGALDFLSADTMTFEEDVPIADGTLMDVVSLDNIERRQLVERAVAAQPDDVISHRVGDFVFTYHGVDLASADPGLWMLIMSPDPDHNDTATVNGVIVVAAIDGSIGSYDETMFAAEIMKQNLLRESAGLPALPMPSTVTHAQPAIP